MISLSFIQIYNPLGNTELNPRWRLLWNKAIKTILKSLSLKFLSNLFPIIPTLPGFLDAILKGSFSVHLVEGRDQGDPTNILEAFFQRDTNLLYLPYETFSTYLTEFL